MPPGHPRRLDHPPKPGWILAVSTAICWPLDPDASPTIGAAVASTPSYRAIPGNSTHPRRSLRQWQQRANYIQAANQTQPHGGRQLPHLFL
jgi:hypothetical protein